MTASATASTSPSRLTAKAASVCRLRTGSERAEGVRGERGVGQGLDLGGLAVAETPHVDPRQLHFLAGLLALGLGMAQHDDGVALLDELIRREAERFPVVADLCEQLL